MDTNFIKCSGKKGNLYNSLPMKKDLLNGPEGEIEVYVLCMFFIYSQVNKKVLCVTRVKTKPAASCKSLCAVLELSKIFACLSVTIGLLIRSEGGRRREEMFQSEEDGHL